MKSLLIKRALLNFFNFQTVLLHHCWGLGAWNMGPPGPQILSPYDSATQQVFQWCASASRCRWIWMAGTWLTSPKKNTFYNFHLQHLKREYTNILLRLRCLVQEDFPPVDMVKLKKTLVVSVAKTSETSIRRVSNLLLRYATGHETSPFLPLAQFWAVGDTTSGSRVYGTRTFASCLVGRMSRS